MNFASDGRMRLDMRIRNLDKLGKRVILMGDLNVSSSPLDSASAEEDMKKSGMTYEEYVSTPNRWIFNQLLEGADVVGERDSGREKPVLWDTCRGFHSGRKRMYTHWEQKINARPANHGSRIDYVLCSITMKSWVSDANIQEGLMVCVAEQWVRGWSLTSTGLRSLSSVCMLQGYDRDGW